MLPDGLLTSNAFITPISYLINTFVKSGSKLPLGTNTGTMPPIPGGPADIFGFTAVEASAEKLFDRIGLRDMHPPPVIPVSETPIPQTILAGRIQGVC